MEIEELLKTMNRKEKIELLKTTNDSIEDLLKVVYKQSYKPRVTGVNILASQVIANEVEKYLQDIYIAKIDIEFGFFSSAGLKYHHLEKLLWTDALGSLEGLDTYEDVYNNIVVCFSICEDLCKEI